MDDNLYEDQIYQSLTQKEKEQIPRKKIIGVRSYLNILLIEFI